MLYFLEFFASGFFHVCPFNSFQSEYSNCSALNKRSKHHIVGVVRLFIIQSIVDTSKKVEQQKNNKH